MDEVTKLTKKEFNKALAKKTRGWLTSKDWNRIEKIRSEVLLDLICEGNRVQTHSGAWSKIFVDTKRKVRNLRTGEYKEQNGEVRVKYERPAKYKERLNAQRDEEV